MRQSLEREGATPNKPAEKGASDGKGPMTLRMKILAGAAAILAVVVGVNLFWPNGEPAPEPPPETAAGTPAGQPASSTVHPHRTPEEQLPEGSGPTSRIGPGQ